MHFQTSKHRLGNKGALPLTSLFGCCRIGEAGKEISTRPYHFIVGRQLKGSVFGGWRSREDIPKLAQRVISGELQ